MVDLEKLGRAAAGAGWQGKRGGSNGNWILGHHQTNMGENGASDARTAKWAAGSNDCVKRKN